MSTHGRFLAFVFLSLFVGLPLSRADDAPKTAESLRAELQAVRQQIQEARSNLTLQAQALRKRQDDLESADPECAQLRQEVKALQSQIIEKRRQLDARLKTHESIRAIDDQRREHVENLRALVEKERALLREISELDLPDVSKQKTGD